MTKNTKSGHSRKFVLAKKKKIIRESLFQIFCFTRENPLK